MSSKYVFINLNDRENHCLTMNLKYNICKYLLLKVNVANLDFSQK